MWTSRQRGNRAPLSSLVLSVEVHNNNIITNYRRWIALGGEIPSQVSPSKLYSITFSFPLGHFHIVVWYMV